MTVEQLINELKKYDLDLNVVDCTLNDITEVHEYTIEHNNYPYDKPDKLVLMLE